MITCDHCGKHIEIKTTFCLFSEPGDYCRECFNAYLEIGKKVAEEVEEYREERLNISLDNWKRWTIRPTSSVRSGATGACYPSNNIPDPCYISVGDRVRLAGWTDFGIVTRIDIAGNRLWVGDDIGWYRIDRDWIFAPLPRIEEEPW